MSITFRTLRQADAQYIHEINSLLQQMRDDGNSTLGTKKCISKVLKDNKAHVIVAFDAEKVVGIIALYTYLRIGIPTAIIEDLVVDTAYRKHGIGQELMQRQLKRARKLKVKTVFLTCRSSRTAARALYKKLGFHVRDTAVLQLSL